MTRPTLLLTRPHDSAQAFVTGLSRAALDAVQVVFSPVLEIVSTGVTAKIAPTESAIFTSANGVRFAPEGQGRSAYCVGPRTTEMALSRGWHAQQAGDTAQELLPVLQKMVPSASLVHLGGVHTRGDLANTLSQAGIQTRHIALYDQRFLSLSVDAKNALGGPCIVPVFSPRSALQLSREAHGKLGYAHIIALSAAVAEPLRGENMSQMIILPAPNALYMSKAVEKLCLNLSLP